MWILIELSRLQAVELAALLFRRFHVICVEVNRSLLEFCQSNTSGGRHWTSAITCSHEMRLLNTTSLKIESFYGCEVPPYAILSHVWGEHEVTYRDVKSRDGPPKKSTKRDWDKVIKATEYAAKHGWKYIWIDTCCINKPDMSELSEAINSMFRWYERAEICYAFLVDVPPKRSELEHPWEWHFRGSKWFTRGWTLQELLAPTFLEFIDQDWNSIGSREELATEIQRATGIEVSQLRNFRQCSVATKMAWAANRRTTREEDRAYSLLGLLGVGMPLIYGEGEERAFVRLQKELIRSSNDESIFVWGPAPVSGRVLPCVFTAQTDTEGRNPRDSRVLATSPRDFAHSGGTGSFLFDKRRRGFTLTNAGLSITAELYRFAVPSPDEESLYLIQLNCSKTWPPFEAARCPMVLFLRSIDASNDNPDDVPVHFRKIGCAPQDWREANNGQWRSLGRHDVLILDEEMTSSSLTNSLGIRFDLKLHNDGPLSGWQRHVRFHLAAYESRSRGWDFSEECDEAPSRLQKNEACVCVVEFTAANMLAQYVVIAKYNSRHLSYGIWEVGFADQDELRVELRKLLESDKNQPFPSEADAPVYGKVLKVKVTPMFRKWSQARVELLLRSKNGRDLHKITDHVSDSMLPVPLPELQYNKTKRDSVAVMDNVYAIFRSRLKI